MPEEFRDIRDNNLAREDGNRVFIKLKNRTIKAYQDRDGTRGPSTPTLCSSKLP
jgi:hypothetical protein